MRTTIDLNCDLGERPESILDGTDEDLMQCISSANVACGGHAGDEGAMEATVRCAIRHGVAVGAHPGYPDRERFGREEVSMSPSRIEDFVHAQVRALGLIARRLQVELSHVKPHGALYHAASRDLAIAEAIARGASRYSSDLVLIGQAGSNALQSWRAAGRTVGAEAFADRVYEADGSLRARRHPDALLTDPSRAARQAVRIARGEGVIATDGTLLPLRAETIGIHADTPGSRAIAQAVREALERAGIGVARISAA